MLIEGRFSVTAPIEKLWEKLFDVQALAACLPGAEEIKQIDDKTYDVTMKQRIGIMKVTMKGRQVLTRVEAPRLLEMEGGAEDVTKLGRMKDKITMNLKEIGNGEVEISYNMDVLMVGKLAMFGDRLMRSKATEMEKEFVKNLSAKLREIR